MAFRHSGQSTSAWSASYTQWVVNLCLERVLDTVESQLLLGACVLNTVGNQPLLEA